MKINELVGKFAIRTRSAEGSNSFTDDVIKVIYVDENHAVIEWTTGLLKDRRTVITTKYMDNNWKEADKILRALDPSTYDKI
jgi:hypothetical protein